MIYLTKPYDHQAGAVERFYNRSYGALFLEQGLGKSKILLDIIRNSRTRNILILAPNGLHANWHHKEIGQHFGDSCSYYWKGTPSSRKQKNILECFLDGRAGNAWDTKFMLMNVEAIRTKEGFLAAQSFLNGRTDTMMVVDESTCIKNPKALVTKACFKLGAYANRRFILTGTPMTQGPLDLFSQSKFLHEGAIPYRTMTAFKARFAIEEIRTFGQRSVRTITGYQNLEHLSEVMSPFSLRLLKKDCLDLPPKVWQTQYIEMTKQQEKAYQELKNLAITQLASGSIVSSTIPLTLIMKLQQVCSGFVNDDEGNAISLPSGKLNALLQIAEVQKPLVIFCAFRQNHADINQALSDIYGEDKVVSYIGGMNQESRTQSVQRFQNGEADFIICSSAGAKGITLTRASTTVYFSSDYKLETRLQSQDRIHRIGQKETCTYVDLVCPDTIDQKIIDTLQSKKQLSDLVLDELVQLIHEA